MIHTIISWDCCFRNFFHLIGALAEQQYPKDQYELIYVEQRSRQASDAYNHKLGLQSLQDTVDAYGDRFNVRGLFLSQDGTHPYHLGVSVNAAIRGAKGCYISVMDGDLLVRPEFLRCLEDFHQTAGTVINMDRRTAARPVGADFKNWHLGVIDFELCLAECPDRDCSVPERVNNFGPLISAPKEWWEAIGGYDTHRIWSTGVSRLGSDANTRLEIFSGRKSLPLPGHICVHPYHPAGFDRNADLQALVLSLQQQLINWAWRNGEPSHEMRTMVTDRLYHKHQWVIEANISGKPDGVKQWRLKMLTARDKFRGKLREAKNKAVSLVSFPYSQKRKQGKMNEL